MGAFLDQFIPPYEWLEGSEKGVLNYVDKKLDVALMHFQPLYNRGIITIQESCKKLYL